jgi:hypothetical protein
LFFTHVISLKIQVKLRYGQNTKKQVLCKSFLDREK